MKKISFTKMEWPLGRALCVAVLLGGAPTSGQLFADPVFREGETVSDAYFQEVKGTVISSADGLPLPGVTVQVKGSNRGTATDLDGEYAIEAEGDNPVLVFSFIGYKTQEIVVNGRSVIDVELNEDLEELGEVVVVGYGEQKKETLTGAIEQVTSEVFQDRAITNPAMALQGQTPGLTVTRGSSRPGREGMNLQIRGATSVNGGSPLIVIDGAPAINNEAFYNMNPDDIENISVLKDASAAIYGSRAANGVILVTTKRGKGKPTVEFNSNFRLNTIGIRPPSPTMAEYATVWLEAAEQDGAQRQYWGWQNEENLLRMQRNEEGIYPSAFWGDIYIGNYPRFDEMYGSALSNQQNLSISGGNDQSDYRISGGYAENVGNLQTAYDGHVQYNVRFNYGINVGEKLRFETGLSYFNTHTSSPSGGLDVTSIAHDPPFFPSQNPYGQWLANFNIAGNRNSVAQTVDGGRDNVKRQQLKLNFNAIYDITDNLNFRATAAFDNDFFNHQSYTITVPQYTWYGDLAPESVNPNSSIREQSRTIAYQNYGAFLNYSKSFDNTHHVSGMVGVTAELSRDKNLYGFRRGFEDNGVYDLNLGSLEELVEARGGGGHWGIYSYVARFNYSYMDKYLVEVNGRRDGSSKFHPDHRWSNFGGASLGWVISEEDFMQNLSSLSFLKIRGSYGVVGNQVGIGNYDYLSTIGFGSSLFGATPALQNSSWVNGMTSLTRTWERVGNGNIGIDFRLFDHKLYGSFDYFKKKNDGMLIEVNYPDLLGANAPKSNSGTLETKGWEAILGYKNQIGDLRYDVSVNMSDNRNELVYMEGVGTYNAGKNSTVQGYPLNSWFMYQTNGFFESDEAVDEYYDNFSGGTVPSYSDLNQRLRAGDTRKLDLDGDGRIDGTGNIDENNGDVKYMGDAAPHYVFGLNLNLQYKNFDLTGFFQGVLEQNIQRSGYMAYPMAVVWGNQTPAYIGKTWTEENPNAAYPRMTYHSNRAKWNWQHNDFMLQNSRYVRLKTLVVGYTFPEVRIANQNLERLRIYFSGNDLFELTSIKDGYDPEFGESSHSSYPFNRTWSLGVNVRF